MTSLAGYATAVFPARKARRLPLSPCGRGCRADEVREAGEGLDLSDKAPPTWLGFALLASPPSPGPRWMFPTWTNHIRAKPENTRVWLGKGNEPAARPPKRSLRARG